MGLDRVRWVGWGRVRVRWGWEGSGGVRVGVG